MFKFGGIIMNKIKEEVESENDGELERQTEIRWKSHIANQLVSGSSEKDEMLGLDVKAGKRHTLKSPNVNINNENDNKPVIKPSYQVSNKSSSKYFGPPNWLNK